jgi:peptidoglycan/LPS O-acetylase OafA/YrhL
VFQFQSATIARAEAPRLNAAGYRPDIDGLRAIAITSVVLFHAASWLVPSGYVGVDIFFVISGYLIGGIIDRDIIAGRFRFVDFYARRARRILPALLALLLAVCAAGCILFSARELWELGIEATGAIFGVANFKFWLRNGYFADAAPMVPLLMTWSLGVEEQFYVVFPGVLLLARRLSVRHRIAVLGALTTLSFIVSAVSTPIYPLAAFYLLPARAWELGAGAMLAIWSAGSADRPVWQTEAAGVLGLVLIAASLVAFDRTTAFPGTAAVLPVLGAVLLLHAKDSFVNRRILASQPFVAIGLLSYSWYLWHWPLMSLAHDVCDTAPPGAVMFGAAGISLVMAYGSWRWIERPFRRNGIDSSVTLRRYALAIAGFAVLPTILIVSGGLPGRLAERVRIADQLKNEGGGECLLSFGAIALPEATACMARHGNALRFGLATFAAEGGYRLWQVEKSACMPLLGVTTSYENRPAHARECAEFLARAIERIAADPAIDTVIIAGAWPADDDPRFNATDGHQVMAALPARTAIREGLPPLIERMQAVHKRVVLVGDVPHFGAFDPMRHVIITGIPIRRLLNRLVEADPYPDGAVPHDRLDPRFNNVKDYVADLAARKHTFYLDIADALCDPLGCRYESNGLPLFVDDTHLSELGSRALNWAAIGLWR